MLGQFTGKDETDSSLDLSGRKGRLLVVTDQLGSFTGDSLEDIVDERVHDRHGSLGDTSIRMDLLQHLVDVSGVRLDSLLGALLSRSGLLGGFLGGLSRHID